MIEFALVFPVVFFLIYSLLGYGLLFMLEQNITLAAEEGARAAIAIDPEPFGADTTAYTTAVTNRARSVAKDRLNWLPEYQRTLVSDNITVTVGAGNVATVRVSYPNYESNPIIPAIRLPGFGSVPPYPGDIFAEAKIQL